MSQLIADGPDVKRRDHVRRKALHVTILVKAEEIVCDLIDATAQMMSWLVDGRNSVHKLAAQMDMAVAIRKVMETSKGDKAKAEKEGKMASRGDELEPNQSTYQVTDRINE